MTPRPYTTVADVARDEFIDRRSRFIGQIAPVTTEEQAAAFLASVREGNREARHNVYAYVLREGGLSRFSDDGEPSGTGGKPVLDVIAGEGLQDVIIVVTRYFGGILLGTGGLTHAYSHGAQLAARAARRRELHPAVMLELCCDYAFYGKLARLLPTHEILTDASDFGVQILLRLCCKHQCLAPFLAELTELSGGQLAPITLGEGYREFPPQP